MILLSHRGPVQYGRDDSGRVAERGGGGLVTAMSGLAEHLDNAVWIFAALTDEDREVASENEGKTFELDTDSGEGISVRMVTVDSDAHEKFYAIIANPMLWFIQHYLWDLSESPNLTRHEMDAFDNGYVPVNCQFADVVVDEIEARGGEALVMIQDYHFYLVAEEVRRRCPDAYLHHFIHIPWPQPDSWRILPPPMREKLFCGLLGNDVVAFHTQRYARNFLLGCQELLGLTTDLDEMTVEVDSRTVRVRWYPISVDVAAFEQLAASDEVLEHEKRLADRRRDHLILRVDRADLSKNILRGFKAFDTLLDDHPELSERVTFLALLQPSRQDVRQYQEYLERIRRVVADVNLKHGTADWSPIDLHLGDNLPLAVAAYKLFDVLVVNAIFDGMNLVAKESVLVNQVDGVLALSENTGAHEELGEFALTLHPFDIQQQADTLWKALTMPREERKHLRAECEAIVRENDISKWLQRQLSDAGKNAP